MKSSQYQQSPVLLPGPAISSAKHGQRTVLLNIMYAIFLAYAATQMGHSTP